MGNEPSPSSSTSSPSSRSPLGKNVEVDESQEQVEHFKLDLEGGIITILDNSAAKHKISIRPRRKYSDRRQRNISSRPNSNRSDVETKKKVIGSSRKPDEVSDRPLEDLFCRREAVVKELLETEDEFCRDLAFLVENYIKPSDGPFAPSVVRDNTNIIFGNLKLIADFHSTILNEGIKYYCNEPRMLGRIFLRLERDFDKHVTYCRDVPLAQEFLANNPQASEFFEELSQKSGDGKNILDYLKLPVQRINDYQVLLSDLVKYSEKLGENCNDLKKAHELMLAIPYRASNNKYLSNIEGFHGNIHSLGRLIRHDWFSIESDDSAPKERYFFLFKEHIIVCKVKKISEDRSIFSFKDLISLSEVKISDCPNSKSFEVSSKDLDCNSIRLKVHARKENVKNCWLQEIEKHVPLVFEDGALENGQNVSSINIQNKSEEEDPAKNFSQKKFTQGEELLRTKEEEISKLVTETSIDKADVMSRRVSERISVKSYEESYSWSGQRETYGHGTSRSSSKFSQSFGYLEKSPAYENRQRSSFSSSSAYATAIGRKSLTHSMEIENEPIFGETNAEPLIEIEDDEDTVSSKYHRASEAKIDWTKDNKSFKNKSSSEKVIRTYSGLETQEHDLKNTTELETATYTSLNETDSDHKTSRSRSLAKKVSSEDFKIEEIFEAPRFLVRLKNTELIKGEHFTFVVKIKGTPKPDVKFYKDDVLIEDEADKMIINRKNSEIGFYELTISEVEGIHAGKYTCKARNSCGEAHCDAIASVTDEKVVFKGLENESLLTPSGEKPSFSWYKDGKSFNHDERFKVLLGEEDDSLALIFQHVKPEDAGLYTCVASTTAGKIFCSAELSVQGAVSPVTREPEKPVISRNEKSIEAVVGESTKLEAKVSGFPKPEVKWYHEDEEIVAEDRYQLSYLNEDSVSLMIKNLNIKDSGTYKIVAKNELGENFTELDLIVKGAPKITKKLKDVTVNVKDSIEIETQIEGYPTPTVKWFKDGQEIFESERIKFVTDSSNNRYGLIIDEAVPSDEGSYSVVATNEVNRSTENCLVKVAGPPEILKKMKKNVAVSEGEEIVFEMEVSEESASKVSWMKDGALLKSDGSKIFITENGNIHTLKIINADAEDSAKYSVEVINEYGKAVDLGEAVVTRKSCAPIFKKGLSDVMAKEGDTAIEFSVEVAAFPKPKIKWYLDELEITEKRVEYSRLETDNNYKLIVKKVTTELKGNYKCRVENECGSAETTAKLTVQSKPVFLEFPEPEINVDEGSELTLQIQCTGCPEPEISWYKDGQEIHTDAHIKITKNSHRSESYSMTLTLIRESDGGNYEARATNCMGMATTQTYIHVFSKITETSEEDAKDVCKKESIIKSEEETATDQIEEKTKKSNASDNFNVKLKDFRNVVKVEEFDEDNYEGVANYEEVQGIVEECLDQENVSEFSPGKLNVDRGISIVSVSDDEKTLSRNDSGENWNELKEREKSEEKSIVGKYDILPEKKIDENEKENEKEKQIDENENENENENEKEKEKHSQSPEKIIKNFKEDLQQKPESSNEMKMNENKADQEKSEIDLGDAEDAVVNDLLKRIKKQRSVLEEILEKEADIRKGGKDTVKPEFKKALEDVECHEKEAVKFECIVSGNPEPEIIWKHGDKRLDADNSDKIKVEKKVTEINENTTEVVCALKIKEADLNCSGTYTVEARNASGNVESSARLSIVKEDEIPRPKIKNLKDKTTVLSEDVTFEATIESIIEFTVTWLDKRQEKITENDRIIFSKDEKKKVYKMTIKNTTAEDVGDFFLVAANESGETKQKVKLSIHGEAPTFVKPIDDAQFNEGQDVDFLIRCNGIPKPEVKWFKNGEEIVSESDKIKIMTHLEGQVSSSLNILDARIGDAGEYKVTATNALGVAENKFKLEMAQTAPLIEKRLPKSLEVDDGFLELKCKISGSPRPSFKWSKNGQPLSPDGKLKFLEQPDGSLKLIIEDASPADSGTYTIEAENTNGTTTDHCNVTVLPKPCKPKFTEGLKDAVGSVGKPLFLEAKIVSYPPSDIKWFKDGRPLKSTQGTQSFDKKEGKIKLELKNFKPEDQGTYSVKASNKLGEAFQEANVRMLESAEKLQKPRFIDYLKPIEAVEKSPVKFFVKAVGNPKPEIKWFCDGKELKADGENIVIKEEPDGSVFLLLKKCSLEDAKEYTATAINDVGQESCHAHLRVLARKIEEQEEKEPSFLSPLNAVEVDEGSDIVLSASISGNPVPEVSWEKDGIPIISSNRVFPVCDGKKVKLEINSSKPGDSGAYTCHLRNSKGTAKNQANVKVKKLFEKPVFEEKFKDFDQVAGTPAIFSCRISGIPKPDVEWYFNGEPIRAGNNYKLTCDGDKHVLTLKDCKIQDSGLYRCSAQNRAGKAECVAHLRVLPKIEAQNKAEEPYFLKKISDSTIYPGMTGKFTACSAGFPTPDFEWFKDNIKLTPSNRIKMEVEDNGLLRLKISAMTSDDEGIYRLRIFNPHGSAECSARLICDTLEKRPNKTRAADKKERRSDFSKGIPEAPADKPIICKMTDRHLTLSWKPYLPLGPYPPVTYTLEMRDLPDGDWFTARKGIRSCACDIRNLEPYRDYMFRYRIENQFGVSEPSPHAETFRQKFIPDWSRYGLRGRPTSDFRPEGIPKDFDFDRPLHEGYKQAPEFLSQPNEVQYGVKDQNCSLYWYVYGYPKPTITYYYNGKMVEMGGKFECSYTRNGLVTLFISRMLECDVGIYEAVARNEHGEARQKVKLEIGEHPIFIRRPEESYIMLRGSGTLTAQVFGVPSPDVKWYKDWQPLTHSSRIIFQQPTPDTFTLTIKDAIFKDSGLYSVTASNIIGSVSSSAMIHIEEDEEVFGYVTYERGRDIKFKREPFSNYYNIGDELGRGTQGITYHAVDKNSGRNYAAKFMHGKSEIKPFMMNELNVMNSLNHRKLVRLHDAFEMDDLIVIVEELAGGGELLEWLIKQTYITEREIANFIRQILWGLQYMHSSGYAHLSLTLNDLLLSRTDGDDLKICDFGLSRRIVRDKLLALNYGMPEFVSPEVAKGEGVSYASDLWSLGIITYILLSGISPFRRSNDRETLTKIQEGKWEFDEEYFSRISMEAKDFISKLLIYKAEDRMDVKDALKHPWLLKADNPSLPDDFQIKTTNLKNYYNDLRNWYKNANCKSWYRRQPLSNAFTHPSKMVYPPGESDDIKFSLTKTTREPHDRVPGPGVAPSKLPADFEVGNFKSESQYQYGPDTYLLQLRDVDLPCRLRHYMKVAADRHHNFSTETPEHHIDWRTPVIRERRKFMDIMDEEIDDERRAKMNNYASDDVYSLRRLKHEIGCRSDNHAEAEAMLECRRDGRLPFFREKPRNLAILQNQPAEISCLVVGDPLPIIQWFKNDLILAENSRIKMISDENGRFSLKLEPALSTDVGTYKVVAKNKIGQSVARMRMVLATVPLSPDPPKAAQISDTEILLEWKHESSVLFAPVLCYSLQYKESDSNDWICAAQNIDFEFFLLRDLKPEKNYDFRLLSKNCAGWSAPGMPISFQTKEPGAPKVKTTDLQTKMLQEMEFKNEPSRSDVQNKVDYRGESSPVEWNAGISFEENYQVQSEVARGRFSSVVKAIDKMNKHQVVAKIFDVNPSTEKAVADEFENLRSLKHERIADLLTALRPSPNTAILVMESLEGMDILSYFASRKDYDEDMIVTALTQVLDGLQYLHWRGFCHLNIQPDNIVLCDSRSLDFKLVDFGYLQRVSKLGTLVKGPFSEYSAPETVCNEPVFPQTDVWSLGTVAYVLLSGFSPFRGETEEETQQNIIFVRYRFEHLFKEITQEATRFLMQIFKRNPRKRPTVDECYETRWFLSSEFIIRKRQKACFPGSRLKEINESYHA